MIAGSNEAGFTRSTISVTLRIVAVPLSRSVPEVLDRMETTRVLRSFDW